MQTVFATISKGVVSPDFDGRWKRVIEYCKMTQIEHGSSEFDFYHGVAEDPVAEGRVVEEIVSWVFRVK